MAFYVYRDGMMVKKAWGNSIMAKSLRDQFGGENLGTPGPFQSWNQAELYRQKWQKKVDADPRCKPPYSIEKD
jgi:hypothetical protein